MTGRAVRALPAIAGDLPSLRERHAVLLAEAAGGSADGTKLAELATVDAEIASFEDACLRTSTVHLMAKGLRWGDELRHPALPGTVVRVRLRDRVEMDGREIGIAAATREVAERARAARGSPGRGPAMADWTGPAGARLGTLLGLEHPARTSAEEVAEAQASLF